MVLFSPLTQPLQLLLPAKRPCTNWWFMRCCSTSTNESPLEQTSEQCWDSPVTLTLCTEVSLIVHENFGITWPISHKICIYWLSLWAYLVTWFSESGRWTRLRLLHAILQPIRIPMSTIPLQDFLSVAAWSTFLAVSTGPSTLKLKIAWAIVSNIGKLNPLRPSAHRFARLRVELRVRYNANSKM